MSATEMGAQEDPHARTLRRCCNACAGAKQRCDLLSSGCSRCLKKKVRCVYANEPIGLCKDKPVAKRERSLAASAPPRHGARLSGQYSLDEALLLALQTSDLKLQRPSFHGVPLTLDVETIRYLFMHLASFPAMFKANGRTPFIDLQVYAESIPESIQDIWSICGSAATGSAVNKALLNSCLNAKTTQLVHSAKSAQSRSRPSSPLCKLSSSRSSFVSSRAGLDSHLPQTHYSTYSAN